MRVQNAACGGVLEENPSPLSTGHMRVQNGAVRRRSGGEPIALRQEYASTERRLRRRSGGEPIASFHRTYASTERRRKAPFWRRTHLFASVMRVQNGAADAVLEEKYQDGSSPAST